MRREQMRHALAIEAEVSKLKKQLDEWVLLKLDSNSAKEIINVGDPISFRTNEYHRMQVAIPEAARRYVFRLWQREIALKLNEKIRELNQLGMTHGLQLVEIPSNVP